MLPSLMVTYRGLLAEAAFAKHPLGGRLVGDDLLSKSSRRRTPNQLIKLKKIP